MPENQEFSDANRALVERYLRGELPHTASVAQSDPAPLRVEAYNSPAVPIQTGGSRRPFFFLHGQWQRGGFFCYPLARALGSDQPFYALSPYRFDILLDPPALATIAAAHLESVRAVQPHGPYLLGGWCNGGRLAYEIARQLQSQGQEVELLVLMDPVYLVYPPHLRFIRATIARLGNLMGLKQNNQLRSYLWLRYAHSYLRHTYSYLRRPSYRSIDGFWSLTREDYPGIFDWAAMGNTLTNPYPGKMVFLWSATQPFRRGWRRIETQAMEVRVLPCEDATCLSEHLDMLAERLRTYLGKIGSSMPVKEDNRLDR